jgi:PGF-pre-PGF domain-containing protein
MKIRKKLYSMILASIALVLFLILVSSAVSASSVLDNVSEIKKNAINQTAGSPKLETAPLNPEFVNYIHNKIYNQNESSQNGYKMGFVPPPVDLTYLSDIPPAYVSAPTYYDLRTQNKVTGVKDQGLKGSCWAFATYASLESYLMPEENWDFSENNTLNLLSPTSPEGFDLTSDEGGNFLMSTAYLARWSGPVNETDDPYDPSNNTSVYSPIGLRAQKHVQDVLIIPGRENSMDNDNIKSAVQNYGAVFTSMHADPAYYLPDELHYYYNGYSRPNHAVAIVGWNDSFDKNKFPIVPPGDGAFIVKNNWGTNFGDNGYFYISYNDTKLGYDGSFVFTAENPDDYDSIYQYDPLGWANSVGYSNPTCWGANIFTAKSNEILNAVSFYTTDSNCSYEIYIDTDDPEFSPISQIGTMPFAGYHMVPLSSGVKLKAGQKFAVVLKLTTSGYGYPVAIESPESGYSSKAKANVGESFVSYDGIEWDDITAYFSNTNVCIKAFTEPALLPVANFTSNVSEGYAPLTIQFNDSSENATSWNWSFEDGVTSTEQNPIHTYSKGGNYTVRLAASNENGTASKTAIVTVFPLANFNPNLTSGYAPLAVQFTDRSQNATGWTWYFGDGATSYEQSPAHTYASAGTYTVNLTVSNGNSTASKTATINVLQTSSGGGGSSKSSGGGGGSPEPASNVQIKELSQTQVTNGKTIKFDFTRNVTCIMSVTFDAKKTAGKTTGNVEMLKEKSTLVSPLFSGEIYKFFNIWIGNAGFASPINIANPVINFKVEKAWIKDKNIDSSSITLNRYSDKKWEQIPASLAGEDNNYLYFSAKTPGFSFFGITGKAIPKEPIEIKPVQNNQQSNLGSEVPQKTATEQKTETPGKISGFEIIYGISGLFAVFMYRRK